ncbi:uncharacterized protein LOC119400171 [Rhipicephalus sanguineus]|uniref:uncharacterized protein LOC119400171 n=1 Tax=Rhipicephalus sanguineus TaxID=34632 RepID=UPI001896264E|nr:uncharacterized protein LOC119400171 [Rhipicephalus sanguineus]
MGDVFCLVILQNGNRRKLKLAMGTYAEFLEKLTAIVDVDLEDTLIQMFDTDLDDFVDLVPGDEIPNKAKLRVVSRSASILCNAAMATCGQNAEPTSPQNLCAIQPASVDEQGEVLLQASDIGIQEAGSDAMETSQAVLIVTRMEDAPCAVLSYRQVGSSDEMQVDDTAISHTSMHNSDDSLKFVLPPSFGVWCDTFLQSKRPVTAKVKTHMVSVLFKACYRVTPYPTPRLYNKVLDSLVAKYPHVMEGKFNRRRWLVALRSMFKSERENLTAASAAAVEAQETCGLNLSQADADDECTYAHGQHVKTASSSEADIAGDSEARPLDPMVSDPTESLEMSEHSEDDEQLMDCPDYSDAMPENVTVSSLLRMCTDEKASEALMAQQESRASLDESESCDESTEEVRRSKSERIKKVGGSVFQKKAHVSNGKEKILKIVLKDCMKLEEETSGGNVNELPLNDRVVVGTEVVPAASPTPARPGTLQGRSSSTDSSESGKQYESFSFDFESLPEYIRKALKAQRPLPSVERRALVRCVVEQLTKVCPTPGRDFIREAARTVVQAFPDALEDRGLDGELRGKGYNSFFQQLNFRADNTAGRRTVSPGTSQGQRIQCIHPKVKDNMGVFRLTLNTCQIMFERLLKPRDRFLSEKEGNWCDV